MRPHRLAWSAVASVLLLSAFVAPARATLGDIPIDTCLTVTNPAPCVQYEDAQGQWWFIASIGSIHPALGEMPFPEGTTFRVTGMYCEDCIQTFCGSFSGFIFGADLVPCLQGDVDANGTVDFGDVLELLSSWGQCPASPDLCPADLTGDGTVNFSDLLAVLANWS